MAIASTKIEGGRGLPFDCHGVAEQLKNIVNAINHWCGDNNILPKLSTRYFWVAIKQVNKTEDEHKYKKIEVVQG